MSSNTKWTAGTLAYIDALCKTHHQPTYSEMAAALMAFDDAIKGLNNTNSSEQFISAQHGIERLAERLRLIGADDA